MPKMTITGNTFSGGGTGIKIEGAAEVDVSQNTFDNVEKPFDMPDLDKGVLRDNRVTNDPKNRVASSARVGWSRPEGPPLPVFCPSCKTVFASQNYVFGGRFYELWGNEEQCPHCGFQHAKLSEGTFTLIKDIAEVITAPDMTHTMLLALQGVVDSVVAGETTPLQAQQAAVAVAPSLQAVVAKHRDWDGPKIKAAMFFMAILTTVLTATGNIPEIFDRAKKKPEVTRDEAISRSLTVVERINVYPGDNRREQLDDSDSDPATQDAAVEKLAAVRKAARAVADVALGEKPPKARARSKAKGQHHTLNNHHDKKS